MSPLRTALIWLGLSLSIAGLSSAQEVEYFRKDYGIARGSQALPDDLSVEGTQLWKTALAPGHSSPCVCGDAIYLTTYDKEAKELATVALDRKTGVIRWRQVAPTQEFEAVHATGSRPHRHRPAMARRSFPSSAVTACCVTTHKASCCGRSAWAHSKTNSAQPVRQYLSMIKSSSTKIMTSIVLLRRSIKRVERRFGRRLAAKPLAVIPRR